MGQSEFGRAHVHRMLGHSSESWLAYQQSSIAWIGRLDVSICSANHAREWINNNPFFFWFQAVPFECDACDWKQLGELDMGGKCSTRSNQTDRLIFEGGEREVGAKQV